MSNEKTTRFIIASKIDQISLLSQAIRAVFNTVIEEEIALYNLELCLVEALTNVIRHAYHGKPDNLIDVLVTVNDHYVFMQITDSGDKARIPMPKIELDPETNDIHNLSESGRGLYIIRQLMDEVSFGVQEGNNVLMMKKYLDNAMTYRPL